MTATAGFPGTGRIFWRGATLRCPRCGSGHLFRRYFHLVDDCPRCALHFEREEGYWVGALAVNIAIVFAIFVVAFVVILAVTVPDVPVGPTLAVLVPVMVLGPIAFYPFSKTLWMSIDYGFLHRLDR
ncbi:MAG: hypothetical protein AMXMBFR46_21050 [Acidimicrobiia bacterium]